MGITIVKVEEVIINDEGKLVLRDIVTGEEEEI